MLHKLNNANPLHHNNELNHNFCNVIQIVKDAAPRNPPFRVEYEKLVTFAYAYLQIWPDFLLLKS